MDMSKVIKEKYIDEYFGTMFKFGGKARIGLVDIATERDDALISDVSEGEADKIIKQYDKAMDFIYLMSREYPKQFNTLFYGERLKIRSSRC